MKKLMINLLAVVMLAGLLSACGDDKKDDNSGGSANPSQSETQIPEASDNVGSANDESNSEKNGFNDLIIEHERTFEVDENKDGEENGFSYDITID